MMGPVKLEGPIHIIMHIFEGNIYKIKENVSLWWEVIVGWVLMSQCESLVSNTTFFHIFLFSLFTQNRSSHLYLFLTPATLLGGDE